MTVRSHLFPFRTQKLSSLVPKIVGWTRPVKIGRCRHYAPLAQLVEQLTLNQWAQGSSPWRCTTKKHTARTDRPGCVLSFLPLRRIGLLFDCLWIQADGKVGLSSGRRPPAASWAAAFHLSCPPDAAFPRGAGAPQHAAAQSRCSAGCSGRWSGSGGT